ASDYADNVKGLLLEAIEHFSCSILTIDPFPGDSKQEEFVCSAWKKASNANDNPTWYVLSDRTKRIVRQSPGAHIHPVMTLCTDRTEELTGFVQHPYISKAIRIAFFKDARSGIGFRFPEAFNPIPTETVALLLTIIRFHLEEWVTGKHIQGQFKETEYAAIYQGILKDINKWVGDNDMIWKNIRAKWYKRAFRAGGGVLVDGVEVRVPQAIMEEAQAELAGRTGLTNSEPE
ncbi:hypothetical protein C8Q76DRAFT_578238, partial [Earliella scabrosa]